MSSSLILLQKKRIYKKQNNKFKIKLNKLKQYERVNYKSSWNSNGKVVPSFSEIHIKHYLRHTVRKLV